jgi:hypothetical protein
LSFSFSGFLFLPLSARSFFRSKTLLPRSLPPAEDGDDQTNEDTKETKRQVSILHTKKKEKLH